MDLQDSQKLVGFYYILSGLLNMHNIERLNNLKGEVGVFNLDCLKRYLYREFGWKADSDLSDSVMGHILVIKGGFYGNTSRNKRHSSDVKFSTVSLDLPLVQLVMYLGTV